MQQATAMKWKQYVNLTDWKTDDVNCRNTNFKWRYDCHSGKILQFKQLQVNLKKLHDFDGIQTHGLCISAAVLYHLSYEDSYCMGLHTFMG